MELHFYHLVMIACCPLVIGTTGQEMCTAGDSMEAGSMFGMSGIFLNNYDPSPCSGSFTALHFCHYAPSLPSFPPVILTHTALLQIWRPEVSSADTFTKVSEESLLDLIPPNAGGFRCVDFTLQNPVPIRNGDILGVYIPRSEGLRMISSNVSESHLFYIEGGSSTSQLAEVVVTQEQTLSAHKLHLTVDVTAGPATAAESSEVMTSTIGLPTTTESSEVMTSTIGLPMTTDSQDASSTTELATTASSADVMTSTADLASTTDSPNILTTNSLDLMTSTVPPDDVTSTGMSTDHNSTTEFTTTFSTDISTSENQFLLSGSGVDNRTTWLAVAVTFVSLSFLALIALTVCTVLLSISRRKIAQMKVDLNQHVMCKSGGLERNMSFNGAYTGTVNKNVESEDENSLYTAVQNDISCEIGETGLSFNEAYHAHAHILDSERQAFNEENEYVTVDQDQEDVYHYVDRNMLNIQQ